LGALKLALSLPVFFWEMEVNSMDKWKAGMPLLFSLVLIVGMIIGFNLRDTLRSKRDISTIIVRNDRLDQIIDLVNEKYVDTVNNNLIYKNAISGILKSLDPHTVYIPSDEVQAVNERLEGSFSGIGIEYAMVSDTIEVTGVIEKGPAANAGVEIGDKLIKVGDTPVAGVKADYGRISHLLKGKQLSSVTVTVLQPDGLVKKIAIIRGLIPTYSVEACIMLDATTGFIKINRFSATTAAEYKTAIKTLIDMGARQLILDLRDNPGGYLDAATLIADDLIDDGKLLVYTKGLHTAKTEYKAKEKGLFEKGKLAILVDEGSASASEILAGAIQDWDRGVIVGRRSFGKGLVQEQYDLPDGAALRLTIARYYTPSGRCIQRSFAQGKEAYMSDYQKRLEDGELTGNDSLAASDTASYYTANHRLVYGGGGIKPDVYVPYDTSKISHLFRNILTSAELKSAIWNYYMAHKSQLKYERVGEFIKSFNEEEQIATDYLDMLDVNARKLAARELNMPANREYLDVQIKARLARFLFRDNGYYSISLKNDDVVKRALTVLNSDSYLKLIGRK
jgi:carboxyl-terminal processing protease